ncbi:MAG: GGDEF domain-containing protein [Leptolyngbya sp. SIO3F4]|nr:GGDEF domain-containing protein [Leptolyngbya sp. SIO3F4]
MINKIELTSVVFWIPPWRTCQAVIGRQWKRLESRISSIIIGFVSAYILLEIFPAINYKYLVFGKRIYFLLLLTLSLYLGYKQVLAVYFPSSLLRASIQNAQLRKTNQQLRKNLREQKTLKQSLKKENRKLYRLANIDRLTQIPNRRFFDQQLEDEWQQLQQAGQPLSVILLDVDYFKRFNDYYGHLAGDHCLQEIARVVNKSLRREADFVARYGGEEFAVVLPNTDEQGAVAIAQTIQQAIQTLAIPHAQSDISAIVSVSLGIASIVPLPESSWTALVDYADQALYEAKRQGRDRYILKRHFRRYSSSAR